jgi:3-phosphoshikimate 1-carboxyvinyltransferase
VAAGLSVERVEPAATFQATLRVPGDKSIAHRALILASIASGVSRIEGVPSGEDVAATTDCLRRLGAAIEAGEGALLVSGRPISEWRSPSGPLDCRNSGTTMRLLAGLLAGSAVRASLIGDASLSRRPMERVALPLRLMGAGVETTGGHPPIRVEGRSIQGITHRVAPASAQVKSALLLAGLHAQGQTCVLEGVPTRDHGERLLAAMGARVRSGPGEVCIERQQAPLKRLELAIPGDLSSAAFLLAAAGLRPGWTASIDEVGLNPTRTAFLELLQEMGVPVRLKAQPEGIEPKGTVEVTGGALRAIEIGPDRVARAIDEIPILAVLATQAEGRTVISGVSELRVKESDRVRAMARGLSAMGAGLREEEDQIVIEGPARLHGAEVDASGDHRVAMALAVAGLVADSPSRIRGADRAGVSYPGFFDVLRRATGG